MFISTKCHSDFKTQMRLSIFFFSSPWLWLNVIRKTTKITDCVELKKYINFKYILNWMKTWNIFIVRLWRAFHTVDLQTESTLHFNTFTRETVTVAECDGNVLTSGSPRLTVHDALPVKTCHVSECFPSTCQLYTVQIGSNTADLPTVMACSHAYALKGDTKCDVLIWVEIFYSAERPTLIASTSADTVRRYNVIADEPAQMASSS